MTDSRKYGACDGCLNMRKCTAVELAPGRIMNVCRICVQKMNGTWAKLAQAFEAWVYH